MQSNYQAIILLLQNSIFLKMTPVELSFLII